MNPIVIIAIAITIILMIYYIVSTDYRNSELDYIDYVYYAKCMLIDAIHDYNTQCIQNHVTSFVDYSDVMDYLTACKMYPDPISWRDLISEDKLELLKSYLPEDPDKYIYNKVKRGE